MSAPGPEPASVSVHLACPKCGATCWSITWKHESYWYGRHLGTVSGEHLYHRCRSCNYAKVSSPLDQGARHA